MSQHFLPLVEQLDQRMRAELQSVERSLDVLLVGQSAQFQSLYQYSQGAAHLWDTHVVTVEERERAFQEGLENCRHQHDVENQNLEANLDVVLDRLRQSASQEVCVYDNHYPARACAARGKAISFSVCCHCR